MKQILMAAMMMTVSVALAAPEEYVTRSATGTTAATVYFEPGPKAARLVVADVTSDKAASVLSWRVGGTALKLLAGASASDTNLYTTVGTVASNAALVSVTAAGTVTPHNAYTNSFITNALVTLENVLGTNVAVGSIAQEVTSTYLPVTASSSTNVVTIPATVGALAVGSNFLFTTAYLAETNQVKSWITNGSSYDITLSNNFSFTPVRAYVLTTNIYTVSFVAAPATASTLILTNGTGLAAGDSVVVLPSTRGGVVRQVQTVESYRIQRTPILAATGLALAAGDQLYVLDSAITTPVGNTTLRLMADPVRVLPANLPAVLSIDGTSACAVNAATVAY